MLAHVRYGCWSDNNIDSVIMYYNRNTQGNEIHWTSSSGSSWKWSSISCFFIKLYFGGKGLNIQN